MDRTHLWLKMQKTMVLLLAPPPRLFLQVLCHTRAIYYMTEAELFSRFKSSARLLFPLTLQQSM
jgi:hypothetical protein